MKVTHILIDDSIQLHQDLPIYRSGKANAVRLADSGYGSYDALEINAHNHTALFHYGVIEALNTLPFISESGNGLDSWDEAFLPSGHLLAMATILEEFIELLKASKPERVLLGWHEEPVPVAYWRLLDPMQAAAFLAGFQDFILRIAAGNHDLELIL